MNKRILVINDDKSVRDAFEGALSEIGYLVETAADGETGLAKAQAQRPDLIFLDLRMPGMDGIEVLRRFHAGGSAQVPVYIVTAFQKEFFESLRKASADGFRFEIADKPLTPAQIQSIACGKLEGAIVG